MALVLASWMTVFLLEKDFLKKSYILVSSLLLLAVYRGDFIPVFLVLFGYAFWLTIQHLKGATIFAKGAYGLGMVLLLFLNGIMLGEGHVVRADVSAGAFLFAGVSLIFLGINRENAKIRLVLFVIILALSMVCGVRPVCSAAVPAAVFLLFRFGTAPCLRVADGIKKRICDKNKEREFAEEGDGFMNGKRGKLLCGVTLLMIPAMMAFVFCIYKLNNKINSVYLITQQIMDEMERRQAEEDYVTQERIDEIIDSRVANLTGGKPKKFTISRFTEADGMSFITCDTGSEDTYRIYQLNMNEDAGGLGYVLQLPTGELVVFDGGYEGDGPELHDFIVEHGGIVSAWILTHPHYDHIGAFLYCMTETAGDMDVQNVYYAPFTADFFEGKEFLDNELEYEALRFDEFEEVKEASSDTVYIAVSEGDRIQVENLLFKCLSGFDPEVRSVNDNSLVLRMEMNGVSMLLTGDITEDSVKRMAAGMGEDSEDWDVDFLQVPHHGYTGTGREFYELTRPRFVLLDCSAKEYQDDMLKIRSETVRTLHEMGIGILKRFEGTNVVVIK